MRRTFFSLEGREFIIRNSPENMFETEAKMKSEVNGYKEKVFKIVKLRQNFQLRFTFKPKKKEKKKGDFALLNFVTK